MSCRDYNVTCSLEESCLSYFLVTIDSSVFDHSDHQVDRLQFTGFSDPAGNVTRSTNVS